MRRAAKTDTFHAPCRELFRAHGCEWEDILGVVDAVATVRRLRPYGRVDYTDHVALIEVKSGARAVKRKGKTADRQRAFAARFPVWRISNEAEALACIAWLKGDK